LINIDQRYISPRQGFSCAHRILHQGESCFQYTKQIILSHGPKDGLELIRQRFRDCKAAHLPLQQRHCLHAIVQTGSKLESKLVSKLVSKTVLDWSGLISVEPESGDGMKYFNQLRIYSLP
jgi:hypothetical protein